jgi:hypothetical protein
MHDDCNTSNNPIASTTKKESWRKKFSLLMISGFLLIFTMASIFVSNVDIQQVRVNMKQKVGQIDCSSADFKNRSYIAIPIPTSSNNSYSRIPSSHYVYPEVMYGHVHMGKTAGTSLNGILANRFTRVCGHKGYSYDAFQANIVAQKANGGEAVSSLDNHRDRIERKVMFDIGFHDCDYVSHEINSEFWITRFGDAKFFDIPMELHVPCRDPLDHLMSYCNYKKMELRCNHEKDEGFYRNIDKCMSLMKQFKRYTHKLKLHFDVKCFDFEKQFTTYMDIMAEKLQRRRIVSDPYIQRETNQHRNKTNECIWGREDLQEKAKMHLLKTMPYYQFCNDCMGSENELTKE